MGYKSYLRVSQNAGNQLFGLPNVATHNNGATPLSMLISQGAKFNSSKYFITIFLVLRLGLKYSLRALRNGRLHFSERDGGFEKTGKPYKNAPKPPDRGGGIQNSSFL